MIYIYDILLNFNDGSRVYEFFEWREMDVIEHVKRIPLFLVNTKVLKEILNNRVTFNKEFLNIIENKTLVFSDYNNKKLKYSCLFTDTYRCYAFELDTSGQVIFKSSLLMDEEEEVLAISPTLSLFEPKYSIENIDVKINNFTRQEEKKINLIKRDLIFSNKKRNYSKINYLYTECFGSYDIPYKERYKKLLDCIEDKNGFYRNKISYILNLSHKLYVNK